MADLKRLRDLRIAYLLGQLRYDPAVVADAVVAALARRETPPAHASVNGATPQRGNF